uniref:BPTI/Kunitz inhibitor domain-containing protein n=1 Tax=Romanomermis culicivorax TaxID=13658 RepID=A0A915JSH1_ROMCU
MIFLIPIFFLYLFNSILAFWPTDLEVVTFEDKIVNYTNICQQPQFVGECRALKRQWYFNKNTGFCEQFNFGGCDANDNNFLHLEECQRVCEDNKPCNEKPEKVPGHYKKTMRENKRGCPVYKVTTDTKRTFIVYEGVIITFNCNVTTREERSVHEVHHERCAELCKYKLSCNTFVWSVKSGHPVCRLLNVKSIQDLRKDSVIAPEGVWGVFFDKIK